MEHEVVYVAITGTKYYYGAGIFKVGLVLQLVKEPDNPHDGEAIRAVIPPIGKVGYVANSSFTVPRGCRSAGGIYYTFDKLMLGKVVFIVKDTVIVELDLAAFRTMVKKPTINENICIDYNTDLIFHTFGCQTIY